MELTNFNLLPILQFYQFKNIASFVHGVTTRKGGVSEGPFYSLNLETSTGDKPERVLTNQQRLLSGLDWEPFPVVIPKQIHSNKIAVISKKHLVKSEVPLLLELSGVDGLITREKKILLLIKVADCIPVFFYDPVNLVVGLIHAGWRGIAQGIVTRGLRVMQEYFSSLPGNLMVGVGPGIGCCCFEVKEEVKKAFLNSFLNNSVWRKDEQGKLFFDLKQTIFLE
ncbi:MAG: polyphenol oxidase family protein, partial [Desulfobacterota bacterium]|nr:polyphenol oxidase family protein [Thermodesulfobacteriota bacterium]